jgi:hypothetical protein
VKIQNLLTANAILSIGLGIAFALYAPLMISLYGILDVQDGNVQQYWQTASFARMFGAALFGMGFLIYSLRGLFESASTLPETRRGILFAMLLANLIGIFTAATQQASVWNTLAGWVTVGVFAVLLLAYGYFIATGRLE